ncbi:aromatic prenyltransferase [Streptomyces sp. NPDC058155]|uniref:aromatic prenyltransferase n=1 Tax=Streptomyces sp. NPDC058155 TaxID=3346359 RepID=UPI0036F0902A
MSEDRTAEFYSVAEKTSRMMGVPISHDKVRPVLTAYQHVMAPAVISFRTQTGPRGADDLDCRWTMLPKDLDPYAVALSNGFATPTGHPVDQVSKEIHQAFPVGGYGFDFGVAGGFKKTWTFFPPPAPQPAARLAELPSMPRSVSDNLAFFERYGVAGIVNTVGIDYPKRTVNLYFNPSSREFFQPQGLRALLAEAGLPEPSEGLLRFCDQAFSVYTTLNWDSSEIERITFSVKTTDPLGLPLDIGPGIEKLVKNPPYTAGEQYVYGVSVTPRGEFHKIQSYYQWHARVESMLTAVDAG